MCAVRGVGGCPESALQRSTYAKCHKSECRAVTRLARLAFRSVFMACRLSVLRAMVALIFRGLLGCRNVLWSFVVELDQMCSSCYLTNTIL